MLFNYRKGTHSISDKAWKKLESAEVAAGLHPPPWEAPSGGGGGGPAVSPSGLGGGQAELLVELRLLRAEVAALRQEQQQLQLALAQSDRARRAG